MPVETEAETKVHPAVKVYLGLSIGLIVAAVLALVALFSKPA